MQLTLALTLVFGVQYAYAIPQGPSSTPVLRNATTSAPNASAPAITGCPNNCTYAYPFYSTLSWFRLNINTTITHATVIEYINNGTNQTSFSTIFNTDLGGYTLPTSTNAAGTVTAAVTDYDYALGRNVTLTAAYPSLFADYEGTVLWSGVLSTSTSGSAQCLTSPKSGAFPLPSHPFLPAPSPTTTDKNDPRGWHYIPMYGAHGLFENVTSEFPDFPLFSQCAKPTPVDLVAPLQEQDTAAFVTVTKTSHVIGGPTKNPSPGPSPAPNAQPPPGPTGGPNTSPILPGNPNPAPQPANTEPVLPGNPNPAPSNQPASEGNNPPAPAPSNQPANEGNNPPASAGNAPAPAPNAPAPQTNNPAQGGPDNGNGGNDGTGGAPAPAQIPSADVAGPTNGPAGSSQQGSGTPQNAAPPAPVLSLPGGNVITATQQPVFVAGSQTIQAGAPATQVGGNQVSIAPDGSSAVVNGRTQQFSAGAPLTTSGLVVGGMTFTAASAPPAFVIGSQTVVAGGPAATIGGNTISVASGASAAVVNGATQNLQPAPTQAAQLTIGGQVITANPQGGFVVSGQTLTAGGAAATISGTLVSVGNSFAVVGGSTQSFQAVTAPIHAATGGPLTIAGQTITPNAQGSYVIGSQTLTAGAVATISGTSVSIASNGQSAIVDSSTQNLGIGGGPLTVAGSTITSNSAGQYVIGSQTLTPGQVATVSGTLVSIASNGQSAVVGTSTEQLGGSSPTGTAAGASFTGAASAAFTDLKTAMSFLSGLWLLLGFL